MSNEALALPSNSGVVDSIADYESNSSLTTNWTGDFATPVAGNLSYNTVGTSVFIKFPSILSTATASTGSINNATALPSAIRPAATTNLTYVCKVAGVTTNALMTISTAGIINAYADLAGNGFNTESTASGNGIVAQTISYML